MDLREFAPEGRKLVKAKVVIGYDEYLYHLTDASNIPWVTVCFLSAEDGHTARGFAICSPMETPDEEEGVSMADERALDDLNSRKSNLKIKTQIAKYMFWLCGMSVPGHKSQFDVRPTDQERQGISDRIEDRRSAQVRKMLDMIKTMDIKQIMDRGLLTPAVWGPSILNKIDKYKYM